MAYFSYTPRKLGTNAVKRIVSRNPWGNEGKAREREAEDCRCPAYDVLVQRSSIQPRDKRLDGEESGQDSGKRRDKSKDDGDTRRHASCSMEVPLQLRAAVPNIIMSKLLDPESTVGPPPN